MTETHSVSVQEDPKSKDLFFEIPPKLLKELEWKAGDDINFEETDDGGLRLTKVEKDG